MTWKNNLNREADESICNGYGDDEMNEKIMIHDGTDHSLIDIKNKRDGEKCEHRSSWIEPAVRNQIYCLFFAGMTSVIGGYTIVYPGIFLAQWDSPKAEIHLSLKEASLFASVYQFASIPSSLVSGFLQEITGPRTMMMINLPLLAITFAATRYCAQWAWLLIILRIIQGVSASFMVTAQTIYACEIPDIERKWLSTLINTGYGIGILLTYILAETLVWHQMVYVMIAIAIFNLLGFFTCHESPAWFIRKKRFCKAAAVLKKIRTTDYINDLDHHQPKTDKSNMQKYTCCENMLLLKKYRYLISIFICFLCLLLRETTGYIAVLSFGIQIFRNIELAISPSICMIILTSIRMICNLLSMVLIIHFQRRSILKVASVFSALSCSMAGIYFYLESNDLVNDMIWMPSFAIVVLLISLTIAIIPISLMMSAEILPTSVKSMGCGIGMVGHYVGSGFVSGSFLYLKNNFGLHICFLFYAIGSFCMLLMTVFLLPETKGRDVEEIEEHWKIVEKRFMKTCRKRCIAK